eukprot:135056-Alexandrium_andersonii.AAC.1
MAGVRERARTRAKHARGRVRWHMKGQRMATCTSSHAGIHTSASTDMSTAIHARACARPAVRSSAWA